MQITDIPIDGSQRETTLHGTPEFPVALYHSVMSRNILGFTNWHWHDELQFCLVTEGEICFFMNERQFSIRQGDGIFIGGGCLHMAKPVGTPASSYLCLDVSHRLLCGFSGSVFERRYVSPYLHDPLMEGTALVASIPWQNTILKEIREISAWYENKSFGYEFEIWAALSRIWLTLLKNRTRLEEGGGRSHSRLRNNTTVQEIIRYITRHYAERISMKKIAEAVSFSESECCRIFKSVTRETIFSYLQFYRITKATEFLRGTELPISQIAYETGFCSTSHFIKIFRERIGMTPLQYRKTLE